MPGAMGRTLNARASACCVRAVEGLDHGQLEERRDVGEGGGCFLRELLVGGCV